MRRKKLLLNSLSAVFNQVVALICGMILPRLIISVYGSAVNGLISSVTHFLALFSMLEMGVGAVVRSSLYKPLADNDGESISRILIASRRFFRRIGLMLCVYLVLLSFYFPLAVYQGRDYLSTALLIVAIAVNILSNYMFGVIYVQLLDADQKSYIQLCADFLAILLNTAISVILIWAGAHISTVKLVAATAFLLKPLLLKLYVDRHYNLDFTLQFTDEPLKQKWNGLAQHIATYVLKHSDTVIITVFSALEEVSVYYVYHLVTNALQQLVENMTSGMASLMGNMIAKNEQKKLQSVFSMFEWCMHTFVTLLYAMTGILILPFVKIYTAGITDANYIVPTFALLTVLAGAAFCLRMLYSTVIRAAGHYEQTQKSYFTVSAMKVILTVAFVQRYGLVGAALGTLLTVSCHTAYLVWYLRRRILNRPFIIFFKHIVVDIISVVLVVVSVRLCSDTGDSGWSQWILYAIKSGCISVSVIAFINLLFYKETAQSSMIYLLGKRRKA